MVSFVFQNKEMMRAIDLTSIGVVGFRFHPTDEELVDHYMKLKMLGNDVEVSDIITEVDLCKFEPWELPGLSLINSENDTSWYFFCRPDYKYKNRKIFNRATKAGFWKVSGDDRMIKGKRKKVIGSKKTLVFHENNKPKPIRTGWVIHEYHSNVTYHLEQREIILCRLKYKQEDDTSDISSSDIGEPSWHQTVYDLIDGAEDTTMGEADDPRLAAMVDQFRSLVDSNQNNTFEFTDEFLGSMLNAHELDPNQNTFEVTDEFWGHIFDASELDPNQNTFEVTDDFLGHMFNARELDPNQNNFEVRDEFLHVKDISYTEAVNTELNCHIETTSGGGSVCFCDRCLNLFLHVFPRQENREK